MTHKKLAIYLCLLLFFATTSSLLLASEKALRLKLPTPNKSDQSSFRLRLKPNTKLVAKSTIGAIGATVKLRTFLYSTKGGKTKPLKGKYLSFRLGKKRLGKAKTNKKGKAALKFKVPAHVGPVQLTVSFAGDKGNSPSSSKAKLKVIKAATKVTAREVPSKSARGVTIEGVLTRTTDNKPLPGREVIATMRGKTVAKAVTLVSGKYRLAFTVQIVKRRLAKIINGKKVVRIVRQRNYSAPTVTFHGNKYYTASAATAKIIPSKAFRKHPHISVACGKKTAKVGDTLMFTVIVRQGPTGEAIANKNVHFMGQQKKTSSLGSAVFFHKIKNTGKLGPRELKATTHEDFEYRAGEGKVVLNVSTR